MPKQHSDKFVVLQHPIHGEKKVLDWVAPRLRMMGWKDVGKKTETKNQEAKEDVKDNRKYL